MLLIALIWGCLGFTWYLAQLKTENIISGRVVIKYNNEPTVLQYGFWSTIGASNNGIKWVSTATRTFALEPFDIPNRPINLSV